MTTSVVTGSPVLMVRLLVDGGRLLIAPEQVSQPDPRHGTGVCVCVFVCACVCVCVCV